jgi:hypothetical protein
MAYSYESIMQAQAQDIEAELAEANAELEAARRVEDPSRVRAASREILRLTAEFRDLGQIANDFYSQQQQQPQGNRFGLSADEIDVAHSHPDPRMTNEQKQELYAHNRARYQHARATGAYRDDQGTVRR